MHTAMKSALLALLLAPLAALNAAETASPVPVQITIHPEIVVKDGLPSRPIGVSENLFYSSDKAYPRRKHTQTESLKMIGGQTIRGMEGDTGDYMIWAMPPFRCLPRTRPVISRAGVISTSFTIRTAPTKRL